MILLMKIIEERLMSVFYYCLDFRHTQIN